MSEFLKDYYLYADMNRLNNSGYYDASFETPQINQFLSTLRSQSDLILNDRVIRTYLLNLTKARDKDVFVFLKWLLCLHRNFARFQGRLLVEKIYDAMSRIELPNAKQKISMFVLDGIIRPYIQHLAKMALIKIHVESNGNQWDSNKQNKENSLQGINSLTFMKYNLIRHAMSDLLPTLVELRGFFCECYPLLQRIIPELHRDLTDLLRAVRNQAKGLEISQSEINSLASQFQGLVSVEDSSESWVEQQGLHLSEKLSFLMESAQKQNSSPL